VTGCGGAGVVEKSARISQCGAFRYWLGRRWGDLDGLTFVMLNPSTADALQDDPTIRRCIGFARREGFDAVNVYNLNAYRATRPAALATCADPVGPDNDAYLSLVLTEQRRRGHPVVAAWGAHARPERVAAVLDLVPGVDWRCLGLTQHGHPRHPLYVRGDQPLVTFTPAGLGPVDGQEAQEDR
jgi:hypothetical protein